MPLILCLAIVLGTVLGAFFYGQRQVRRRTMAEWAIGGRRLGSWIFWFLNAGEIYTTFAVLGIAGYAWAYGAPAYLALTSVSLASAVGYWLMPQIWAVGRGHGLLTQADFFAHRYGARWLAIVVALAGIAVPSDHRGGPMLRTRDAIAVVFVGLALAACSRTPPPRPSLRERCLEAIGPTGSPQFDATFDEAP